MECAAQRCVWCEEQVHVWQLHAHVSSADDISKWAARPANQVFITLELWLAFLPFFSFVDPKCSTLIFFFIDFGVVAFAEDASDIISLQLTASFALQSQNIHNNAGNVWLCPLTPIHQCTCVRRTMDMCWEDEFRCQPLRSDPDCKSVRALTADCFSSGLQRQKKVAGNLGMNDSWLYFQHDASPARL